MELQEYIIPDDGREMGLQGMINDLVKKSDYLLGDKLVGEIKDIQEKNTNVIASMISAAENCPKKQNKVLKLKMLLNLQKSPVLGITGTGELENHHLLMS